MNIKTIRIVASVLGAFGFFALAVMFASFFLNIDVIYAQLITGITGALVAGTSAAFFYLALVYQKIQLESELKRQRVNEETQKELIKFNSEQLYSINFQRGLQLHDLFLVRFNKIQDEIKNTKYCEDLLGLPNPIRDYGVSLLSELVRLNQKCLDVESGIKITNLISDKKLEQTLSNLSNTLFGLVSIIEMIPDKRIQEMLMHDLLSRLSFEELVIIFSYATQIKRGKEMLNWFRKYGMTDLLIDPQERFDLTKYFTQLIPSFKIEY